MMPQKSIKQGLKTKIVILVTDANPHSFTSDGNDNIQANGVVEIFIPIARYIFL
jgi:hypothetical protein